MKIRPVGAELFHADRQTDRQTDLTKRIVVLRSFSNAPRIDNVLTVIKEIHCVLRNQNLYYRFPKTLPMGPILNHNNPVHTPPHV